MALYLTENFKKSLNKSNIKINIILEIDGFSTFSSTGFSALLKFDEGLFFDQNFYFDSITTNPYSLQNLNSIISYDGTSGSITQSSRIDKGIEGTRTFSISLLDENNRISRIFTSGNVVDEVIGRSAKIYFSLDNLEHPNDSVLFLDGYVSRLQFTNSGKVIVTVDHSFGNIRKEAFTKVTTNLINFLNDISTGNIPVDNTTGLIAPITNPITGYIKIDDEIIKYSTLNTGNFIFATERGALGTTPAEHEAGASVESLYKLEGNPFDIALNLLLGSSGYQNEVSVIASNTVTNTISFSDALLLDIYDLELEKGIVVGDYVLGIIDGNLIIDAEITDIKKLTNGKTYIRLKDQNFNANTSLNNTIKFKSKYDLFGYPFNTFGARLDSTKVDIKSFEYLKSNNHLIDDHVFYIDDSIDYLDFIHKEIFRPLGIYFKTGARISVRQYLPPLYQRDIKILDENNVINPAAITSDRSINKYYYNSVVIKYDKSFVDGKYKTGKVFVDSDSVEKFNTGLRPYKIESSGLRQSGNINAFLNYVSNLIIERYKDACEVFRVSCQFSTIDLDVEDSVLLNGLNIYDIETGNRGVNYKLLEVINKEIDLKNGICTFTLLDATGYKTNGRFGVIAPSSICEFVLFDRVVLKQNSFGINQYELEKYEKIIDATFIIYNKDYSDYEEVTIKNYNKETNTLFFNSNISTVFSPSTEEVYFSLSPYDETNGQGNVLPKELFTYINPVVQVLSVVSNTEITVDPINDLPKFFVGSIIDIRGVDHSLKLRTKVKAINNFTLELEDSYTPLNTDYIEKIGFVSDNGKAYIIT